MNKFLIVVLTMALVCVGITASAQTEELPTIGKITIAADVQLQVMVLMPDGSMQGPLAALLFEQQTFPVLDKRVDTNIGQMTYLIDVSGIVVNCPVHGREVANPALTIFTILPQSVIDGMPDKITLELF